MDKFPEVEVDGEAITSDAQGDFLSREKAVFGDEAAREFGEGPESDTEVAEFTSNYPSLDDGAIPPSVPSASEGDDATTPVASSAASSFSQAGTGHGPAAYVPTKVNLSESEFLKDWKVKNDLEVERRDKVSKEKQAETRSKAEKAIDEFYHNYNSKSGSQLEKVKEEAEEFLKKRDDDIAGASGTTWDRVAALLEDLGTPADGIRPADKKRFKELVVSLKGDKNAPGAGGY